MPIKDRNRKRLIRLGIIRLGHKEKGTRKDGSTYEYPVQDDHFLLHDAPDVEAYYHRLGIDQVREMRIRLPFTDLERNFPTWYQVWAGGIVVCQGDGEYVEYAAPFACTVNQKNARTSVRNSAGDTVIAGGVAQIAFDWGNTHFEAGEHVPCPGGAADLYPHCAACKLNSILKVLMAPPELLRLGYYQITTGSGRNYDTIRGTLELIPPQFLNQLEYTLRIVEGQTSYKDADGVTRKTTRYFLEMEPDPEMLQELFRQQWARTLGSGRVHPELPEHAEPDEIWEPIVEDPPAPPPYAEVQSPDEAVIVDADAEPVEEEAAGPHEWTPAEAEQLFKWTRNDLVITDTQALNALGVSRVSEYAGDLAAARATINAYVNAQIKQEQAA